MADRYWVGGTGTWDATNTTNWSATSGGAGGASVPTFADNVFFNTSSGSGTVTISSGNCAQINISSTALTFSGTGTLEVRGQVLSLPVPTLFAFSGLVIQRTISTIGGSFTPTAGAGGYFFEYSLDLTNSGVTFTLGANFRTTKDVKINFSQSGTFDITNRTITCKSWIVQFTSATATITTTSSAIHVGNTTDTFWEFRDERSATGTNTYNTLTLHNDGNNVINDQYVGLSIQRNTTIAALTATGRTLTNINVGGIYFSAAGTSTFTIGTLTLTGTSAAERLFIEGSNNAAVPIAITTSASLSNADFSNLAFSGTGAPYSGTALGNCGGCTGLTFTAAVTRYAVVAGNWSATATWSATSGGAGGASVPLPQDTAIFNAASAAGTYALNSSRLCNIDLTGFTRTISHPASGGYHLYGNVDYDHSGTISGLPRYTFRRKSSTLTLATNNKSFPINQLIIDNACTLQITENFTMSAGSSIQPVSSGGASTLIFSSGITATVGSISPSFSTVTFNNATLSVSNLSGSGSTLNLGSSTINIRPEFASPNASLRLTSDATVNAGTSQFNLIGAWGTSSPLIKLDGKTIYNFSIQGTGTGAVIFDSDTTGGSMNNLTTTRTTSFTVQFAAGETYSFTNFGLAGANSSNRITLKSTTNGVRATLNYTGATLISGVDFLSVQDINGTPANKWYVGNNSVDLGNNLNVYFTSPFGGGLFFGSNF